MPARGAMTHRERVEAALKGEAVDRMPISIWHHFPERDATADGLTAATVERQRQLDFDLVKLMPTGLEAKPREKSPEGIKALFYAIEKNNLVYAQKVLSMHFDPNLHHDNGYTPLAYAAMKGSQPMVELLLRNGADPMQTTKEGDTGDMNAMVLVKGSKNQDLALKFMDFWLSTPMQTKIAEMLIDSPANKEVVLAPEIAEKLTYGADVANKLTFMPAATTLDYREKWLAEWNTSDAQ